jgi:hypothetical protein
MSASLKRETSQKAVKALSKVLRTSTSKGAGVAAASILPQSKSPRETNILDALKRLASKVLRDNKSSQAAKRAAAITLAQTRRKDKIGSIS